MVSFVHISIGVVKQQGISTSNQIKLNHLPLFIEVSVPRQESEWSCNCVRGIEIVPTVLFLIFHFIHRINMFSSFD